MANDWSQTTYRGLTVRPLAIFRTSPLKRSMFDIDAEESNPLFANLHYQEICENATFFPFFLHIFAYNATRYCNRQRSSAPLPFVCGIRLVFDCDLIQYGDCVHKAVI